MLRTIHAKLAGPTNSRPAKVPQAGGVFNKSSQLYVNRVYLFLVKRISAGPTVTSSVSSVVETITILRYMYLVSR